VVRNFRNISSIYLIGLTGMVGVGCSPKQAVAPRTNIEAPTLKAFPETSIEFRYVTVFLWHKDVQPEQISTVLSLSDQIDEFEKNIKPTRARLAVLEEKADANPNKPLIDAKAPILSSQKQALARAQNKLDANGKQTARAETALTTDKGMTPHDPDKLAKDTQTLATLKAALPELQKNLADAQAAKAATEKEIADLSPEQVEMDKLQAKSDRDSERKIGNLQKVMKIVYWYDPSPTLMKFQFNNKGQLDISIEGWGIRTSTTDNTISDPNHPTTAAKPWNFSTKPDAGLKPTIVNATYTKLGGFFDFVVNVYADSDFDRPGPQTRVAETYTFNIGRTDYNNPDGKIYYTGTLKKTTFDESGAQTSMLDGVAKLVDKSVDD
jgi:hypothetical protein